MIVEVKSYGGGFSVGGASFGSGCRLDSGDKKGLSSLCPYRVRVFRWAGFLLGSHKYVCEIAFIGPCILTIGYGLFC